MAGRFIIFKPIWAWSGLVRKRQGRHGWCDQLGSCFQMKIAVCVFKAAALWFEEFPNIAYELQEQGTTSECLLHRANWKDQVWLRPTLRLLCYIYGVLPFWGMYRSWSPRLQNCISVSWGWHTDTTFSWSQGCMDKFRTYWRSIITKIWEKVLLHWL